MKVFLSDTVGNFLFKQLNLLIWAEQSFWQELSQRASCPYIELSFEYEVQMLIRW